MHREPLKSGIDRGEHVRKCQEPRSLFCWPCVTGGSCRLGCDEPHPVGTVQSSTNRDCRSVKVLMLFTGPASRVPPRRSIETGLGDGAPSSISFLRSAFIRGRFHSISIHLRELPERELAASDRVESAVPPGLFGRLNLRLSSF